MNDLKLPPLNDKSEKNKVRKLKLPDLSSIDNKNESIQKEILIDDDVFNSDEAELIDLEDEFNDEELIEEDNNYLMISGIITENKTKNGITMILVKDKSNTIKYIKIPFEDNSMLNEYVEIKVEEELIGITKNKVPVYQFIDILKREDIEEFNNQAKEQITKENTPKDTNTKGFFKNALAAVKAELAESRTGSQQDGEYDEENKEDSEPKEKKQKKEKPKKKSLFSKLIKLIIIIVIFVIIFIIGKKFLFSNGNEILTNDSTEIEILNSELKENKLKIEMKNKSNIYADFYIKAKVKEKSIIPFVGKTIYCEGPTTVLDLNQTITEEINCEKSEKDLKLKSIDIIVEN